MYSESFDVPQNILDSNYLVPIGKAKIMREGNHVTLVAFSKMVKHALEAASEM